MQNYLKPHLAHLFKVLFWLSLAITSLLLLIELKPDHSGWPYKDKLQHIFSFFVLTKLGLLSYASRQNQICIGLACYGLLMEGLQGAFTVTRTASLYDWLADCVGICVGLGIIISLRPYIQNNTAIKNGS